MTRTLFLVRHAAAAGQAPDAPLTAHGEAQAELLAEELVHVSIERIVSSPFARAVQTAMPLAARLRLSIETDARLAERILSGGPRDDWRARLRESFDDPDVRLPGGESSREATARGLAALRDMTARRGEAGLLVTHGNLLTLLLRHFDARVGFDTWAELRSPDVYRLEFEDAGAMTALQPLRIERWDRLARREGVKAPGTAPAP